MSGSHRTQRPVHFLLKDRLNSRLSELFGLPVDEGGSWALATTDRARPCSALLSRVRDEQLLEVELPDATDDLIIDADLPVDHLHQLTRTRRYGDAWLAGGASLLLRVPSVVVGRTHNLLFNPAHPLAAQCRVLSVARYPFDLRLVR
ncbi:MAG: hypothetical protein RIQ60_4323 [Pseudomonadota bacterium]|jgi:RES domain-containing protein